METLRFVKFWLFEGTPNPAVLSIAELRPIRKKGHEHFGKYTVYNSSPYEPLDSIVNNEYLSKEEAEKLLSKFDFIPVKSDFDENSLEDLREIKALIPPDWIEWYNAANEAYN